MNMWKCNKHIQPNTQNYPTKREYATKFFKEFKFKC